MPSSSPPATQASQIKEWPMAFMRKISKYHPQFPIKPTITMVEDIAFVNYELGMFVARDLFQRSAQVALSHSVHARNWEQRLGDYQPYREDARGGKAWFELRVYANLFASDGTDHVAFAELQLECGSHEYFWQPNFCSSYICIDGTIVREIYRDVHSGNIELRDTGRVSDAFRAVCEELWPGSITRYFESLRSTPVET